MISSVEMDTTVNCRNSIWLLIDLILEILLDDEDDDSGSWVQGSVQQQGGERREGNDP